MRSDTHNPKFVLVGIVKTGSTSMRNVLQKYGGYDRHHYILNNVSRNDSTIIADWAIDTSIPEFEHYFKFAFVRNPWERVLSHYMWGTQIAHKKHIVGKTFHQFVQNQYNEWTASVANDHPRHLLNHKPMIDWVRDDNGDIQVDFIGKKEDMQGGWKVVCDRLGIEDALPRARVSKHDHYSSYYDDKSQALVGEMYAEDADIFDYRFELQ